MDSKASRQAGARRSPFPCTRNWLQPSFRQSNDQYAEWWQGQNMQIFASPVNARAPQSFLNSYSGPAGSQKKMVFNAGDGTKPTCKAGGTLTSCTLSFFTDTAGTLPKFGPSQLVEATLGATQVQTSPPIPCRLSSMDQGRFRRELRQRRAVGGHDGSRGQRPGRLCRLANQAWDIHTYSQHLPIS